MYEKILGCVVLGVIVMCSFIIYDSNKLTISEKEFREKEFDCNPIILDSQNFGLFYDEELVSENEISFSGYTKFLVEGCLDGSRN